MVADRDPGLVADQRLRSPPIDERLRSVTGRPGGHAGVEQPGQIRGIQAQGVEPIQDEQRVAALVLGCEGEGASTYFQNFEGMLKRAGGIEAFRWSRRSRRPPEDPTNAALSFAYALLTRLCHSTLQRVGFDPMLGFLHQPRAGRPALALDFMEEFRPVLADSAVLMAFNNGELRPGHFLQRGPACALTADGRRTLIGAWERRLDGLVTHPVFGYRLSYRRVLEVQARLLARHLLGELDDYPEFLVR